MVARLRLLPLLLLAGCVTPAEERTLALQAAVASSERSLAMFGAAPAAEAGPGLYRPGADPLHQVQVALGSASHPAEAAPPAATAQHAPSADPVPPGAAPPAAGAPALATASATPIPAATSAGLTSAAQLLGAAPEMLRRWLGEPGLRRAEGGAEVWLYAAGDCALDLVLYREGAVLRVAHAAARASGTRATTEGACLHALAASAASRPPPTAAGHPPATAPGV